MNTTRVSEAKDRARNILGCGVGRVGAPSADTGDADSLSADATSTSAEVQCTALAPASVPRPNVPANPLLSAEILAALQADAAPGGGSDMFPWARERMRVLTAILVLLGLVVAAVLLLPVVGAALALAFVAGGFVIWLLPILIIALSDRTTGAEKLA